MKSILSGVAILVFSVFAFAQGAPQGEPPPGHTGPCAAHVEKCKGEGLKWGDHKMAKCVHDDAVAANDQACIAMIKAHKGGHPMVGGGKAAPSGASGSAPAPGSPPPPDAE